MLLKERPVSAEDIRDIVIQRDHDPGLLGSVLINTRFTLDRAHDTVLSSAAILLVELNGDR